MERHEITHHVNQVLGNLPLERPPAPLQDDDRPLKSLGVDSLGLIQLVVALEARLGVPISDAEAITATTSSALVGLVQGKLSAAESGAA